MIDASGRGAASGQGWGRKRPAGSTPAIQAAMQHLMDSGDYQKILDNWGLTGGAITTSQINGAIY